MSYTGRKRSTLDKDSFVVRFWMIALLLIMLSFILGITSLLVMDSRGFIGPLMTAFVLLSQIVPLLAIAIPVILGLIDLNRETLQYWSRDDSRQESEV
ncbi:MAG: hypothetical protein JSW05_12010 [Candidatus Thorarchaeota archaeon]|nr:MAG: hypothetical protein JSW05_12010 [Candidatus Thorarchaeota archaeon]